MVSYEAVEVVLLGVEVEVKVLVVAIVVVE